MPEIGAMILRRANDADAGALARFAARVFDETFGPDNSPQDMADYLAEAFGRDKQAAEIADTSARVVLAMQNGSTGEEIAGYAHFLFDEESKSMMLKRLYVDATLHGGGLARRLIDDVIGQSRQEGATRLWLTVWERNARAIAFYKKSGFVVSGETTFDLGGDVQTDLVMELDLAKA